MFNQLIEFVKSEPIFSGFIGSALIGTLTYSLRQLPKKLYELFLLFYTINITVESRDQTYYWILQFLAETNYSKNKCTRLFLRQDLKNNSDSAPRSDSDAPTKIDYVLFPSYGYHFFLHNSLLLLIHSEKSEIKKDQASFFNTLNIRFFTTKKEKVHKFLAEIKDLIDSKNKNEISIYMATYNYFAFLGKQKKRDPKTLILDPILFDNIKSHLDTFINSEQWYIDHGIPYNIAFLLYGDPGTGKSSCIKVLASIYNLPIYIINLSSLTSDSDLQQIINSVPYYSILLFEDIDTNALVQDRDNPDIVHTQERITLSGFLNAIDGVSSSSGKLIFYTTNKKDNIDKALLRPGRMNYQIEFKNTDAEQVKRFYLNYYPNADQLDLKRFVKENTGLSHATVQQKLIDLKNGKYEDDLEKVEVYASTGD